MEKYKDESKECLIQQNFITPGSFDRRNTPPSAKLSMSQHMQCKHEWNAMLAMCHTKNT